MRYLSRMLVAAALLILAGAAWAQCPSAIGSWSTYDGTMIGGRASEAWCGAYGNPVMPGQTGNTENAMSWDGMVLGGQWRVWGMEIDAAGAMLLNDSVVGGEGTRTYLTNYDGGTYWLSKDHTWGDGLVDLVGSVHDYQVIATVTYEGGVAVGATSNISFNGTFDNCPQMNECELRFAIANAMLVWRTGMDMAMPADYPDFLCGANGGELFEVCCITIDIFCTVDDADATWGAVKSLYR